MGPKAHWTKYYKIIERATIPVAEVTVGLSNWVLQVLHRRCVEVVIGNSRVPCRTKHGPGVGIKHDRGRKASRPRGLNSQSRAVLALVIAVRLRSAVAVPVRAKFLLGRRQRGKL